jgi:predicted SPOUT superfamily RNA methylase MTH1
MTISSKTLVEICTQLFGLRPGKKGRTLKIPNHLTTSNPKMLKINDIRDGLIINYKGKKFVDIGINKLIPYFGKEKPASRIILQINKNIKRYGQNSKNIRETLNYILHRDK